MEGSSMGSKMIRVSIGALCVCLTGFAQQQPAQPQTPAQPPAQAQGAAARPPRTPAPTRDPNTPGYVKAKELPDGTVPSPKENGNFVIGPTHPPAPEMSVKEGVPQGQIFEFTMESKDSKFYPGIARDRNAPPRPDPSDPSRMLITSVPTPYTRKV